MTYDVQLVDAAPRTLAAVKARTDRAHLGQAITGGLDKVYAHLRANNVTGLGHNVVIYRSSAPGGAFDIAAGVETPSEITPAGEIVVVRTPGGKAATTAHWGPYSALAEAHGAVQQWLKDQGLRQTGLNWEVYGDWSDDPAKLRTDVFYLIEDRVG